MFSVPCCDVYYEFRHARFVCTPICFIYSSFYIYVRYIYLCILVSNTISMSEMFVLFNSNAMDATCGAGTVYPSRAHQFMPVVYGACLAQSLIFPVVLCRSFFVFWPFSFDHCNGCSSFIYGFWLPFNPLTALWTYMSLVGRLR